ncbi:hypothetical protein OVY48_09880 [Sphingobium sp. SA2]|uniref:hypothetical protein n=1 Tax=Sphingobium sp. SA2 TaxID=1524832 RepID=UPI0028BFFCC8|nr:hypothetical protein [Sphingobium sp. SA2]MDT7533732.1 hypothetical protein [Sphingobium sp. SA2]
MGLKRGSAPDERANDTATTGPDASGTGAGTGTGTGAQATTAASDPSLPTPPPIAAPIIAVDDDGQERPMSGGSFVRINGKLTRQES